MKKNLLAVSVVSLALLTGCGSSLTKTDESVKIVEPLHVCEGGKDNEYKYYIYGDNEKPDKTVYVMEMDLGHEATDEDRKSIENAQKEAAKSNPLYAKAKVEYQGTKVITSVEIVSAQDYRDFIGFDHIPTTEELYSRIQSIRSVSACDGVALNNDTDQSSAPGIKDVLDKTANISNIRPEVKQIVDEYESYMKEYANFIAGMNENDMSTDDISKMSDYLEKSNELASRFDGLSDEDLNADEYIYFAQAQLRISQYLQEIN